MLSIVVPTEIGLEVFYKEGGISFSKLLNISIKHL